MKKTVPLVVYIDGERRIVGTAEVEEDGSGEISANFDGASLDIMGWSVPDFSIAPTSDQTEYNFRVM